MRGGVDQACAPSPPWGQKPEGEVPRSGGHPLGLFLYLHHPRCSRVMHTDPAVERDACGVGFVADVHGRRRHTILSHALTAVASMRHRGAGAADGKTAGGAGVLTQLPYRLLRRDMPTP